MLLVAFLHPTPEEPEIAIVRLSKEEHDALHKDPLGFVNKHKIFGKDVSSVDLPAQPDDMASRVASKTLAYHKNDEDPDTFMVVFVHQLSCTAKGACFAG